MPTYSGRFFCAQKLLKHTLVNFCMKAFKALYIEPSLLKALDFVYATYTPFTPFTPFVYTFRANTVTIGFREGEYNKLWQYKGEKMIQLKVGVVIVVLSLTSVCGADEYNVKEKALAKRERWVTYEECLENFRKYPNQRQCIEEDYESRIHVKNIGN
jgi:hypothetical protein